jgi:peptide deformylase
MILPIYAYGQRVLKKSAKDIDKDYEDLDQLIEDMWETMYNARGVGLAAPQIGKSIRLFLVDTEQVKDDDEQTIPIKKAFINAEYSCHTKRMSNPALKFTKIKRPPPFTWRGAPSQKQ